MFKYLIFLFPVFSWATEMRCVPVKSCSEKLSDSRAEVKALKSKLAALESKNAQLSAQLVALESKNAHLNAQLEASESKNSKTQVIEWTKVKYLTQKQKKHILSVVAHKSVQSVETSSSLNTEKATVNMGYIPGLVYQYQFDSGVVPMVGTDKKGLILGVGWEF